MLSLRRSLALVGLAAYLPNVALASVGSFSAEAAFANAFVQEEDPVEKAKNLYSEAEALFAEKKYTEAAAKYEEAYGLVPEKHGFAYKVADSAFRGGDCAKAKQFYDDLLQKGSKEPKLKDKVADAKKKLKEIEATKCDQPKKEEVPEPVALDQSYENPLENENPLSRGSSTDELERLDAAREKRPLRTIGISTAIFGGLVVLAGGVGLVMAKKTAKDLNALGEPGPTTFPAGDYACRGVSAAECPYTLQRRLTGWNVGSMAAFAVGGVAVLGGLGLIWYDSKKHKRSSRQAMVVPMMLPGGGGAVASMRF